MQVRIAQRIRTNKKFLNYDYATQLGLMIFEGAAMKFNTCDLCDAHEDQLHYGSLAVLPPFFHHYGKRVIFAGQAATLKVFEDNVLVRKTLETSGNGRVLVIDGGGSLRCALVGGNLAVLAEKNG